MNINWAHCYFLSMYVVTVPLYVCILWKMYKRRNNTKFSTTFLALLISQGVVDLLFLNSLLLFGISSYVILTSEEKLDFTTILCNMAYKCLLCAIYVRGFGVLLMSFQRYLTICRWTSWLNIVSSF
ncbi:hypothetical protein ANCCAN_04959 [Ancylostoma caninum]|uniref:G-protein coupled receptors family 1 profile domain-containing protein n=1 Tax=Ancylostoma caninum TaxID=29170 RepID=A0A368H176_ANCCA|nr:hypothetical protein ANCCAN_04959 [Ancylostoma caninum]